MFRRWIIILGVRVIGLTSCQTISRHLFSEPERDWQAKIGQLQYRGPRTSLIGEVLVRFSKQGDFELTFTKGPGVTLMMIRQNASFVRVTGPLARGSWSGSTTNAPTRLRGWLEEDVQGRHLHHQLHRVFQHHQRRPEPI
jgi:hypothetical protein